MTAEQDVESIKSATIQINRINPLGNITKSNESKTEDQEFFQNEEPPSPMKSEKRIKVKINVGN